MCSDWSLCSFMIHGLGGLGEVVTDYGCQRRLYMLMSDLTLALKSWRPHLNMYIENAVYNTI